jgi:3-phenylpropionate/cinnamic acid dioxygenase small subunit
MALSTLMETQLEVTNFYNTEAYLLEEGRYYEWLALLTKDVLYSMPVRESVQGSKVDTAQDDEFAFRLFHDDFDSLQLRVDRLATELAHTESPPSIVQRFISNVRIEETEKPDEITAHSNFIVYQLRHDIHESVYVGKRVDKLRRVEGEWKISARRIVLAQKVIPRAIALFF